MLGERQIAAPLMARRAAHRALILAHRGFQPGEGVGVHLARLRVSGQPKRPAPCQFGHQTPVLVFALLAPAAPRPGQHGAVRRQCARQMAPIGHPSTVRQRFARPVLRDDQEGWPAWSCPPVMRFADHIRQDGRDAAARAGPHHARRVTIRSRLVAGHRRPRRRRPGGHSRPARRGQPDPASAIPLRG